MAKLVVSLASPAWRFGGLFLILLMSLALVATSDSRLVHADLGVNQYLLLTTGASDYTIENEYYKAIIPKPSVGDASGIIKHLYIKKADGNWSNDLVYQGYAWYGLGYLEGVGSASNGVNNSTGMQNNATATVTVLENTATRIKIESTFTNSNASFSEIWTFWAKKAYFQSDSNVTQSNNVVTNQFQFAWMVNSALPISWYGTDGSGNVESYTTRKIQQIHSPNLNTFPWLNWQFTGEGTSLGLVFTDINSRYTTVGETGDMPFEYQLDFQLGSGSLGSPVKPGYARTSQVIYYTSNSASNTPIQSFANNTYQNGSTSTNSEPVLQATADATDAYGQNAGVSSALVNSPYFLLRQNAQNRNSGIEWAQYTTSIYAPLYKNQDVIHSGSYDFKDQLQYSLNYANDAQTFSYGTISSATPSNSSDVTSLQNIAASSDGELSYSTTFKTWGDSDKLQITGTASNGSPDTVVKDIYMSLTASQTFTYEAETATPTASITGTLSNDDNLWTDYTLYSFDSGSTLIFRDNGENVPPVAIPVSLPSGSYSVRAYVNQRIEGALTYKYSTDGITYSSFVVPVGGSNGSYNVDLGVMTLDGEFYINDDDLGTGIAGYGGWDKIVITPTFVSLGSNVYDLQISDPLYTTVGTAIKVNSPTDNVSNLGTELRVYLYKQDNQQALTTFSYPFDVEVYPHTGALENASEFTALHNQNSLTYTKHSLYVPQQSIHTGRTNTAYTDGSVTYSADPYNSSTEVGLAVTPSSGTVNVNVNTWQTSGTYYRTWTETASESTATTAHTISGLKANTNYIVTVDSSIYTGAPSGSAGQIGFTYNGGYSSTRTFELTEDLVAPTAPSVFLPSSYITSSQPIFLFNKASDSNGISSYSVSLDPDKTNNYSRTDIPATGNGTANYIWQNDNNYRVEFLNEEDGVSSNDLISVTFKASADLGAGLHTWRVTTYDKAMNDTTSDINFYIDQTSLTFSNLDISGVGTVSSGNKYTLASQNLVLTGQFIDIYVGSSKTSDTFNGVASGPSTVTVTIDRLVSGEAGSSQALYESYLTQTVGMDSIVDSTNVTKTGSYTLTVSNTLSEGDYKISLSAKDVAGNSSSYPEFYVNVLSLTTADNSTIVASIPENISPTPDTTANDSVPNGSTSPITEDSQTDLSVEINEKLPEPDNSVPDTDITSTNPTPKLKENAPEHATTGAITLFSAVFGSGIIILIVKIRYLLATMKY